MAQKDLSTLAGIIAFAALTFTARSNVFSQEARAKQALASRTAVVAAEDPSYTRKEDVVYGRKYGTALTMDVFTPGKDANGAAVLFVVSGGFVSNHDGINLFFVKPFLKRGYTVFAVVHGCQPRFQVPEIVADMNRSVRFIRHHAKDYNIDPNRIGVTGASAGGHLSLMLGAASDKGNPKAGNPIDRESSRVQAVACFFPATDLLNYGASGQERLKPMDYQKPFRASFDYRERNEETNLWERVTDPDKLRKITHDISPIYFVNAETAPTLLFHGDKDQLVPLQQSETFIDKLKGAGVDAKLVVKKGAGHGWASIATDLEACADWFDGHLKKQGTSTQQPAAGASTRGN